MTQVTPPTAPDASTAPAADGRERRRNPHLRAMIDEMMATIRAHVNRELWTPDERATAEADLERIMRGVREKTFSARGGVA